MRNFLLDSNALADCMFQRKGVNLRVDQARARGDRLGTSIAVVAEILTGTEASPTRDKNLPVVNGNLRLFRTWPFEMAAAREYARLHFELKRNGITMQVFDLLIAATAMVLPKCTVVSSDSDFLRVPGLSVENWAV